MIHSIHHREGSPGYLSAPSVQDQFVDLCLERFEIGQGRQVTRDGVQGVNGVGIIAGLIQRVEHGIAQIDQTELPGQALGTVNAVRTLWIPENFSTIRRKAFFIPAIMKSPAAPR